MISFNKIYFILSIFLLAIEVFIALFINDSIIRPYGGDFLVVIWLYCLVKSFVALPVNTTAVGVLIFAFFIELMQYFKMVEMLGLKGNRLAEVVLGTNFEWIDILSYTLGALLITVVEHQRKLVAA